MSDAKHKCGCCESEKYVTIKWCVENDEECITCDYQDHDDKCMFREERTRCKECGQVTMI